MYYVYSGCCCFISISFLSSAHSRFNVVLVALALGRDLDGVALRDDVDVALEVPLRAARDVLGVGQQGPLVVELVIYSGRKRMRSVSWTQIFERATQFV